MVYESLDEYKSDALQIESLENRTLKLVTKATEYKSKFVSVGSSNGDRDTCNTRTIEGELLGIRYRVYLPTPNGNWAMMEFAEPKRLLKETTWPSE